MTAVANDTTYDGLLVEDRGLVRVLTLNHPERRNALDLEDRIRLREALVDADREARAIVLTGAAPMFSAGGDISSMTTDPVIAQQRLDAVAGIAQQMAISATPIVAAVEGGAFGLGLALVCSSDLVVASSTSRFAASFVKVGLAPDTGLSWSLPQRVGRALARRMVLTAHPVDAAEALEAGLVDEVVDEGSALDRAVELANALAASSAPAIAAVRRIFGQPNQSLSGILAAEAEAQMELFQTPEFAEGQAAFLERRPADFVGAAKSTAGGGRR
ncbi:enoyl-CoA hydratase/isomerase family protein [Nocardioides sp. JQ2195]|uniref:enoyl-CoA hydratase/isomerase family protein n=1 Tax=Nocardioides sp. JQ2195 TaxID=2592334 RepID=UPI00143EA8FA|nr:enoyl-CoA hydratase/isomerase family protein [Nocardioides sp. JQ2195]QIX25553.1 enoyl-CoA hydratase/isomerase family protein [Nocardioides sp. JQ2195]